MSHRGKAPRESGAGWDGGNARARSLYGVLERDVNRWPWPTPLPISSPCLKTGVATSQWTGEQVCLARGRAWFAFPEEVFAPHSQSGPGPLVPLQSYAKCRSRKKMLWGSEFCGGCPGFCSKPPCLRVTPSSQAGVWAEMRSIQHTDLLVFSLLISRLRDHTRSDLTNRPQQRTPAEYPWEDTRCCSSIHCVAHKLRLPGSKDHGGCRKPPVSEGSRLSLLRHYKILDSHLLSRTQVPSVDGAVRQSSEWQWVYMAATT